MAKGYSTETLRKFSEKVHALMDDYNSKELSEIPLCISSGNVKIGKAMNVSKLPIFTCPNCSECRKFCYDIKACIQYGNVIDARTRNTVIFNRSRDEFFSRIDEAMKRRRTHKFLRYHVGGEMKDSDEFGRLVKLAESHPDFVVWTYTKNYKAVNDFCDEFGRDAIPENLKVMFSEWKGMPIVNPYGFPVFRCWIPEEEEKPTCYKCPGNCEICKACCRGCIKGEDTYTELH